MSDAPGPAADELLRANRDFYRAFTAGDFVAMDRLWAEHHALSCAHPGQELLRGRERVMASWRGILSSPAKIRCRDASVTLLGEAAVVTCVELIAGVELAATNVFVRERDRWRMLHHQAGLMVVVDSDLDEGDDDGRGGGRLLN